MSTTPLYPPKVENVLGWVACSTRAAGKMPQCLKLLSGGGGGGSGTLIVLGQWWARAKQKITYF